MGKSLALRRKRRIGATLWLKKSELHAERRLVPRRRGRASKAKSPGGRRQKHERVSR